MPKFWFLMYLQCYKWTLDDLHHENARQPSEQNLHTWNQKQQIGLRSFNAMFSQ